MFARLENGFVDQRTVEKISKYLLVEIVSHQNCSGVVDGQEGLATIFSAYYSNPEFKKAIDQVSQFCLELFPVPVALIDSKKSEE